MAVTMAVAALDLNDRRISAAQRLRHCGGHCPRRYTWSSRKSAGGKSD
jgi:hypothetical protein